MVFAEPKLWPDDTTKSTRLVLFHGVRWSYWHGQSEKHFFEIRGSVDTESCYTSPLLQHAVCFSESSFQKTKDGALGFSCSLGPHAHCVPVLNLSAAVLRPPLECGGFGHLLGDNDAAGKMKLVASMGLVVYSRNKVTKCPR